MLQRKCKLVRKGLSDRLSVRGYRLSEHPYDCGVANTSIDMNSKLCNSSTWQHQAWFDLTQSIHGFYYNSTFCLLWVFQDGSVWQSSSLPFSHCRYGQIFSVPFILESMPFKVYILNDTLIRNDSVSKWLLKSVVGASGNILYVTHATEEDLTIGQHSLSNAGCMHACRNGIKI